MTNFDIYIDLKPSEKAKETNNPSAEKPQTDDKKGSYKQYKDVEKEQLFFLVEEKGMSVRAASQKLSINVRTAQGWLSKNNKDPQEYIQRSPGSGRPVGRPPVLTDEQNNYMIQLADENIDSVVLEDMLDALTEKFGYLQITRNGFYKFARQKCKITFKKAHLQPVERNTPEKIKQRYEWRLTWISQAIVCS